MSFTLFRNNRGKGSPSRSRHGARSKPVRRSTRLVLEVLEDRNAPAVYTVTGLGDSGSGSGLAGDLRYCITHANSAGGTNTIDLTGVSGTISLGSALPGLSTNLSLQGPGATHLTVRRNASASFSVFTVTNGATVNISGLTITTGQKSSGGAGGGIYNYWGTVTVSSCTLSSNSASYGGGICNGSTLTVSASTLSSNTASTGGGIYNVGTLTIDNASTLGGSSSTYANTATYGGGIFNTGTVTVDASTLSRNSASYGGGVYSNAGATLTLQDSSILSHNTASTSGGGIYNLGALTVSDSTLGGSTASLGNSAVYGGGLYNAAALTVTVTVNNSTVSNNAATNTFHTGGGGIFNNGTLTVSASLVTSNTAGYSGGGLANFGTLTVTASSVLSSNSAPYGAGLYNGTNSTLTVSASTLSSNIASTSGGGAYNDGTLTVNSASTLTGNRATYYGGGAYNTGTLTVDASTFSSNSATNTSSGAGGGLYNNTTGTLTVRDGSTLSGNSARYGAGAYNLDNLTVSASTITNNTSAYSGGGLANYSTATINTASTVSGNSAPYGAGLYNGASSTLTVSASTLSSNTAGSDGGGIYNDGSLNINNVSLLSGNSAHFYGGALYSDGSVTVSVSTFSGNSASTQDGGAIANDGTVTVSASTFYGNIANTTGGAISNWNALTVSVSTFSGNTAGTVGGGIYNDSGGTATVTAVTLSGNSASSGGGIANDTGGTLTLRSTLVSGNQNGDVAGILAAGSAYNLIGGTALLAPLGNYGGPTQTLALLPGSPAIDAGDPSLAGSTDQRGIDRDSAPDIGALESQGFTFAATSGGGQSALVNIAFAQPLVVTVRADVPGEPVAGGEVTFAPPATGAVALLTGTPATIASDGTASVTVTANACPGQYSVTASATGAALSVSFSLINVGVPTVAVSDAGGIYNGLSFPATATVAGSNGVFGPSLEGVSPTLTYYVGATISGPGSATGPTDAGTYTVVASFAGRTDYITAASDPLTFAIALAPLTVTTNDATRNYGQANPLFTVTYAGFVNGENAANLGGGLSFTTAATASSNTGTYAVTPGGLPSSNYALTFVDGTLTVKPAPLTIAANDTSKTYGVANPAFTVAYDGFVLRQGPGDLGGSLGFVTPATSSSSAGAYAVTPGGLTSSNCAITLADGTLTVKPAPLTITANEPAEHPSFSLEGVEGENFPEGAAIDPETGAFIWTASAGSYDFRVRGRDGNSTAVQVVHLRVEESALEAVWALPAPDEGGPAEMSAAVLAALIEQSGEPLPLGCDF